jgi:hypothetical protein
MQLLIYDWIISIQKSSCYLFHKSLSSVAVFYIAGSFNNPDGSEEVLLVIFIFYFLKSTVFKTEILCYESAIIK